MLHPTRWHVAIFLCLFGCTLQLHTIAADGGYDVIETMASSEHVHAFVSKVDFNKDAQKGWDCKCYNITGGGGGETECRCSGRDFKEVPINLGENLHRITVDNSDITVLERDSFQPYRFTLHEVSLGNLPTLRVLERGTFRNITHLKTLYISQAPQIKVLDGLFDGFASPKFSMLRIVQTSLIEIPDLSPLRKYDYILHMVDLEGNKIETIGANAINVRAAQVILNYNEITVVEDYAFNGSQISKINMRGNRRLTQLKSHSFGGLESLLHLDVSETAITELPVIGLKEIELLKIENTPSMKRIPSVYDFPNLQEAFLTHPFHCCAFKYPEQHDPVRHAQHQERIRQMCENLPNLDTGQLDFLRTRKKRDDDEWSDIFEFTHDKPAAPNDFSPNLEHLKGHPKKSDHSHLDPLTGVHIAHHKARPLPHPEIIGVFHNGSADLPENNKIEAFCGNLTVKTVFVKCFPEPDALNPCEDIMGSYYLRVSVWFVLILAVVGNFAVVCVMLFSGGELTVPRFLMCNLAFADLCMGLYLFLIACMDLHSVGTYFNYAFDWQYGLGCQIAGFLTVFASQLSIFTLTMVTVERWFAIAYAIYLTRRIRLGLAAKVMLIGWAYSILMASLPIFGVSNYSSTSICLPMEVNRAGDRAYLIVMILINGLAFISIVFCYAQIYFSLGYETRHSASRGEMTIAKKMALLVFTDFACWAPIAFFALTALAGYPLIGVTRSKILLVFFYPLNSCANPYLYAIMTAQYRKDFFILLARLGLFKNKAKKYSITNTVQTNNTPMPLLMRTNGRKSSVQQSALEDIFV